MTPRLERASVIGAGAMGSMCALLLAGRGTRVTLWARSADRAGLLQADRENRRYLPGHPFPDGVVVTHDAREAFADPQLVVSAVPCQYIRRVWGRLAGSLPPVVSVAKGIEVETLLRPTQILKEILDGVTLAALSGPCLAPEAAAGLPTAVVVASEEYQLSNLVQEAFSTHTFRVYTNTDLVGVEFGGAAKNVIAIAAGACDGLKLGNNAKASLLTRGLVEITRLGMALGAHADTFKGLAGIGDLIATCNSTVSRNHTAGERIGRGVPLDEVIRSANGIIEGIDTTRSILQLAELHHVEMPITRAIYRVLFENQSPKSAIDSLMTRQLKGE
ncbi:MAG: NAD(P)H-dependent glycerol-3-phosphate dehydrogenase [Phycisphaerae bacterium]